MIRALLFIILFVCTHLSYSQVKIGDNPNSIHSSSILELESTDKVLVITRMTSAQMNAVAGPYAGALVYNTDENCVYMFNGSWVNLCNTSGIKVTTQATPPPPANNNLGDFWINNAQNNATSIWNGSNWVNLDDNPTRGNGAPNTTTAPNPQAGDVYVDATTGIVYAYNGTTWVQNGGDTKANNGLLVTADNTVQLGGVLIKPTIITTDATNTLTIEGLQEGNVNEDDVVTINRTNGQLRKINTTNLFREKVDKLTATANYQLIFDTGFTLYSTDKVNVYRNGVRIDFTINSNTQITLEPDARCYIGDEIRIVQFY